MSEPTVADLMVIITKIDERGKSTSHRVNKLEDLSNAIHEQNNILAGLVKELQYTNKSVSEHEGRLDSIESKPAKQVSLISNTIITTITGALASGLVATLILLLGGQ